MTPLLSIKKALGFGLTILAAQFMASAAQSQTEQIGMLDGGWVLSRNQAQGRCVIQSPMLALPRGPYGLDNGLMLINIKKANPQELVLTFSQEGWFAADLEPGKSAGILSIYKWTRSDVDDSDNPKGGLYINSFADLDLRDDPIWSASTDENQLQAYISSQGKRVFSTAVVASNFAGKDPETGEAIALLTFLTDQKYSTDKMDLVLEFEDTAKFVENEVPGFVIPLSLIPDISPLLQCIK